MATEIFGHVGKLLRVNLSNGQISKEEPNQSYYKHYLGGQGIMIQTLLTEVAPEVDPLGPENKLIFATGPLTGHKLMGTGRCGVGSKSPLTGAFGEADAGGLWGVELKKAGYDAIILEGKAEEPVFLSINNDNVEIRNAQKIWGTEVRQATEWFKEELKTENCRSAVIGPGGENLVNFASIVADCAHTFGRCGMGAVMGSKNLKGVVVKGDKPPKAEADEKILALNRIMKERYKQTPFIEYGTGARMTTLETVGTLPIRNYAGGRFPNVGKIDAVALMTTYGVGMGGCFNCPIRCKKKIRIEEGPWEIDPVYGGPEYETLASFGSNLLIDDIKAICKAHEMCNRHGLDTISTGATIAFAMECFDNGILTLKDTDGIQLNFGNVEAMIQMIERIAFRQGIGDLLAEGSKKAAETIGRGAEEFAMHVKGLEIPYHEPRYKQGLGLHYTIYGTGADHCSGVMDDALIGKMKDWESLNVAELMDPTDFGLKKARMVYELGLWSALPNYLGYCIFVPWNFAEIRDAVSAVTGWPVTTWKLMKAAERGITMMRIFNLREGFTREDDKLPDRFYNPPADGPIKDVRVDPDILKEAQEAYYQMMGWNSMGVPTKGCLVGLDLEWAIPLVEGIE